MDPLKPSVSVDMLKYELTEPLSLCGFLVLLTKQNG